MNSNLPVILSPAERCYLLHKQASKRYYDQHKEKVQMRMRIYYESNKEKLRRYKATYYQNKKQNTRGKNDTER